MGDRSFDLTERIIHLRSIPVAAMLSAPLVKVIASHLVPRRFTAGTALMKEGEPVGALELLLEGRLVLSRQGQRLDSLSPPQSLGFLGVLGRGEAPYSAVAEVDTFALELDGQVLLDLLEDHYELTDATMRYLCERLLAEIQELPGQAMSQRMSGQAEAAPAAELDLVERIVFLRGLRAYSSANLNALAALARQLQEIRLGPGERIWDQGDPPNRVLFIRAGSAVCETDGGKRWRVEPNSAMGGMEVVARKARWYTASAETPLVGFWVSMDAMADLFEDDFTMAMNFVSMLANEVSGVLAQKAALGKSTINVRRDVTALGTVPVGA